MQPTYALELLLTNPNGETFDLIIYQSTKLNEIQSEYNNLVQGNESKLKSYILELMTINSYEKKDYFLPELRITRISPIKDFVPILEDIYQKAYDCEFQIEFLQACDSCEDIILRLPINRNEFPENLDSPEAKKLGQDILNGIVNDQKNDPDYKDINLSLTFLRFIEPQCP